MSSARLHAAAISLVCFTFVVRLTASLTPASSFETMVCRMDERL